MNAVNDCTEHKAITLISIQIHHTTGWFLKPTGLDAGICLIACYQLEFLSQKFADSFRKSI
jgi:hypothetical protein